MKRAIHALFVLIARYAARLLPDRSPVTFAGAGALDDMGASIRDQGVQKLLVVTDATLVQVGVVDRATGALDAAGVAWSVYSGVEPDPTYAQVQAGHSQLVAEGCDGVLAVGGGSPMDAAKIIAAMATNGGQATKLVGKLRVRKPPAPLFAVPTTAGTGSEVSVVAVVTDPATHTKKFVIDPKLIPAMAALDPTLMLGLPPAVTAATGMDALTHAIESYLSKAATAQTRGYSRTSVRLVFEHLPKAYGDGQDIGARTGMALASYYGGLAFTRASVGYVHAIAHNLGAVYGTPHGLANAITLPHVLEFSRDAASRQLAELADVIGVGSGDDASRAGAFIDAVRDLMATVGIPPTLDALRDDDIAMLAERACAEAFLDYPVPRFMDQAECEELLRKLRSAS